MKYERTTTKELSKRCIPKPISVGHQRVTKLTYYYDLIGGTCNWVTAEYFAKILSTYWADISSDKEVVSMPYFDFIVTPKEGSPLLGYEFAKLCNKPFVMHEGKPRFNDNMDDIRRWFDCDQVPQKGSVALLVDDSITRASMMESAVNHLREYGYKVNTCLVVFEVCVKNGRQRLKNKDITLVEVVKTHNTP